MWFYTLNGENFGPISEADLDARIASGQLAPSVNVWREGMANWLPLDQVRPTAKPALRVNLPPVAAAAPSPYADSNSADEPAFTEPAFAQGRSRLESFSSWGMVVILFIAMFAFIGVLASRPRHIRAAQGMQQRDIDETEEAFQATAHLEGESLVVENKSGFDWPSAAIQFRSGGFRYQALALKVPKGSSTSVALGDFINTRGRKFVATPTTRKPSLIQIQVQDRGSATVTLGTTL